MTIQVTRESAVKRPSVCVALCFQEFTQGGDTTGTARPTKRVPVGADAVEDAPRRTCELTTLHSSPLVFVAVLMIDPKTGFLHANSIGYVSSN